MTTTRPGDTPIRFPQSSTVPAEVLAAISAQCLNVETDAHLERIAHLSQLIARGVARRHQLSDEFVAWVFLFARLHDVGMAGLPEAILRKPSRLTAAERVVMKTHVGKGLAQIDKLIHELAWADEPAARVMRNIVADHHERGDGTGYPLRKRMAHIPVEARIVAVADVFDAMSSTRLYRRVWSEREMVIEFRLLVASGQLDADCVAALLGAREECDNILRQFPDVPGLLLARP